MMGVTGRRQGLLKNKSYGKPKSVYPKYFPKKEKKDASTPVDSDV